ncbi:MAG: nickel-dependent hydrogenase large subunit [Lachnospiraceae bacterium]|nr:nickel-dependent hydrogenase large subunit [Lachnospiraceae bacterium]MEE3378882.1 nickel-dependent hydrogenase large subunit [Lachnospiraceae bacterium]MEE3433165.1 nickel-dependent hydrogenase large subunit [Lachnospiraceae bacterium]
MGKRSVVPFGPQHPVLPEPIHLDLVIEDEKIMEAIPNIGFIHRGLEGLTEKRDFKQMTYVIERTCGICSFGHGMGYVETIEHIMGVEVPDRAKYLRTIWHEMSRIHSHLLWLGLMADAFGFESLFYQAWRIREKILDLLEMTTGGRVIFSVNKVGGVIRDINAEQEKEMLLGLAKVEQEIKEIEHTFLNDYSVQSRLRGVGILTKEQAHALGCCGPFARASGLSYDMRKLGHEAYGELDFEPITSNDGDSYARCAVRINELYQSIDLIRQAFAKMPAGDIAVDVKGMPNGEYFNRVEQPRGEAVYYVKADGTKFLNRFRLRTPTFANLAGLCEMLKGAEYADVGILALTIDPCISCTER